PFYNKYALLHFLNYVRETENELKNVMLRVLAFTGLRRGESLGFRWKDIKEFNVTRSVRIVLANVENIAIYLNLKSHTSKRTISLGSETLKVLQRWRRVQREELLKFGYNSNSPEQLVFTNKENRHLNLYYIGTALQRIIKTHSLKHINVHGFRHTHCALLF